MPKIRFVQYGDPRAGGGGAKKAKICNGKAVRERQLRAEKQRRTSSKPVSRILLCTVGKKKKKQQDEGFRRAVRASQHEGQDLDDGEEQGDFDGGTGVVDVDGREVDFVDLPPHTGNQL